MGTFAKISKKLKFGSHYRMERFAFMFTTLLVCLILVTGFAFGKHVVNQDKTLNTKVVYSDSFTTSKTNITGHVSDVFVSKDKTKALVLLRFDDISKISTNADNYQAFLTSTSVARNPIRLKNRPSGSIYMFGNSGYMGIYLVNNEGFTPQVLDLTIRCNSELVSTVTRGDSSTGDKSFEKYDQFRIVFNPGGQDAKSIECLNRKDAPSVMDLYKQAVVNQEFKEIKKILMNDLEAMRIAENNIKEYEDRLENVDNVQVPSRPSAIAGDKIVRTGELKDKSVEEIKSDDVSSDGLKDLDGYEYIYKPKVVLPGGFDFDWQHRSIEDGYLDRLIEETKNPNMTYEQFFAMKIKELNAPNNDGSDDSEIEWILKDGTKVSDLNTGSDIGSYSSINSDCQALVNAWQNYYSIKSKYQREDLKRLLNLEAVSALVDTSASINTSSKALLCY